MTVGEVAEHVGYSSASTFSVAFTRHVGLPPKRYARKQAESPSLWLPLLARDSPSSGAVARELLGWEPTQPGLTAELEAGHYFR
jgi:hypothetical protein